MKEKVCGIYKITNNINGMEYCGQSINCMQRWSYHKTSSANRPIDQAIDEYGVENFTFKIEKECLPEELDFYERETIKKYNTLWPNGYNMDDGGRCGFNNHEETRRKKSESAKKRTGEKHNLYGKPRPETTRIKISETMKGKPHPYKKYKWLTPSGEIREMTANLVSHWHKDWIKIEE